MNNLDKNGLVEYRPSFLEYCYVRVWCALLVHSLILDDMNSGGLPSKKSTKLQKVHEEI